MSAASVPRASREASTSLINQGSGPTCTSIILRNEASIDFQFLTFVLLLLVTLLSVDSHFVHVNIFFIASCMQTKAKVKPSYTLCGKNLALGKQRQM